MTAPTRSSASPGMWIGLLVMAAAVVLIAFAGQDDSAVGGFADPNGTGPEGLLGFVLFIEEAGGVVELDVASPVGAHDLAILATPAYNDVFAAITDEPDRTEENYAPILAWVEAGGTLITSVDIPEGPIGGTSFNEDEDARIQPGLCTIDALAGLREIRPLAHTPVVAGLADESCFGEAGEAVVVVRRRGEGQIVRLASMGPFFNRALDDVDNGALAARLLRIDDAPTVAILSGPVLTGPGDLQGPVDDEGNPVGAGDDGVFDLVPTKVIAMLVGLAGAFLIYALSRGRRLGSPVHEPIPIELPSSTYVDAIGRLYGRAEHAQQRSGQILRADLRTDIARRVGMSSDATAADLAGALGPSHDKRSLVDMLDGTAPASDAELVALATVLNDTRTRVDRGGVTTLLHSDEQTVSERNTR